MSRYLSSDHWGDQEAADAEANSGNSSIFEHPIASDPVHGGCIEPHRDSTGDYVDCAGRSI
ncbi:MULTISPECIES: hypothetical protein [unclassified Kitasatospora]|uniref:hypothetical protein n=1 Tax=unclassified Kitasatospora TaxID=2633591 RepID=UPI0012F8F1AE|nr:MULTISPECIES: hypothetical protein [unclassified Kitasatospora]